MRRGPGRSAAGSPGGGVVLVDLGGAADFETGQGCSGDEAIFDPVYGAPEQFIRAKKTGIVVGGFGGLFGGGGNGDAEGLTVGGDAAVERMNFVCSLNTVLPDGSHNCTSEKHYKKTKKTKKRYTGEEASIQVYRVPYKMKKVLGSFNSLCGGVVCSVLLVSHITVEEWRCPPPRKKKREKEKRF